MEPAQRQHIDSQMLESLATSFEMHSNGRDLMVSFHPQDIADLLRRAAKNSCPRPRLVSEAVGNESSNEPKS